MASQKRFPIVDQVRGIAVFLMIIYHFIYDLRLFQLSPLDKHQYWFWWGLPRIIVFLFLFSMGIGLCLAHQNKIHWKSFNQRFLKILLGAIVISVSTYLLYPTRWIYFGTLHCIAATSIMALPFLKWPKLSFALSIFIPLPVLLFDYTYPWILLPHKSMDYIPALPWISVVLLGIFAHFLQVHEKIPSPKIRIFSFLSHLGKHSFWIYLIHQPILFAMAWIIYKIVS